MFVRAVARHRLDVVNRNGYYPGVVPAPIRERWMTLQGLVGWANGDVAGAKRWFQQAIAASPLDATPHIYLAQLLAAEGNNEAATQQRLSSTGKISSRHTFASSPADGWTGFVIVIGPSCPLERRACALSVNRSVRNWD